MNGKEYEHILMDWDGSIVKTLDVWLSACRIVLENYGHELTDLEIGKSFGAFPGLLQDLGVSRPNEGMSQAASLAIKQLPTADLYPGALDILRYLQENGKTTALLTSSEHNQVQSLLQYHNLEPYFKAVVTGETTTHRKPNPEPLLFAMQHLGARYDNTIIVGDSSHDILAGSRAGIDSVLVFPPEHHKFYDLEALIAIKPTFIIENIIDLKEIV